MAEDGSNNRRASTGATYSAASTTRPYSHVITSSEASSHPYVTYHHRSSVVADDPRTQPRPASPHRLQDSSSNFFSERRLSQLFDVDSWVEDDGINGLEGEDNGREPPPEPAPRASYCPPSPPTSHQYSIIGHQLNPYQSHDLHYPTLFVDPELYPELSPSDGSEPRFSGDFNLDFARLSTLSGASSRFSSSFQNEKCAVRNAAAVAADVAVQIPLSPNTQRLHSATDLDKVNVLENQQVGVSPASRPYNEHGERSDVINSCALSLPSMLSELGQQLENADDEVWIDDDDDGDHDGKVDWQNRCLELEMSLQKFRDHAGKIRSMLHEKVR